MASAYFEVKWVESAAKKVLEDISNFREAK